MQSLIESVNPKYMKKNVTDVKSGDTVRVHQKIKEGSKERTQVFEGIVIGTRRQKSHSSSITVRRIASGVGVEKTFLVHSPLVVKIEVTKRSNVRRDKLNYMKIRSGKSARLSSVEFDRDRVNAEAEGETIEEEAAESTDKEAKAETTDEKAPKQNDEKESSKESADDKQTDEPQEEKKPKEAKAKATDNDKEEVEAEAKTKAKEE